MVRLRHADAAEAADVVDALLDVVVQDAVAALQSAAFAEHLVRQDAAVDSCGDLRCARCFRAVADHAGDLSK